MKKGKKLVEALKKVDRTKVYTVEEAVKLVKETSITKFKCIAISTIESNLVIDVSFTSLTASSTV